MGLRKFQSEKSNPTSLFSSIRHSLGRLLAPRGLLLVFLPWLVSIFFLFRSERRKLQMLEPLFNYFLRPRVRVEHYYSFEVVCFSEPATRKLVEDPPSALQFEECFGLEFVLRLRVENIEKHFSFTELTQAA